MAICKYLLIGLLLSGSFAPTMNWKHQGIARSIHAGFNDLILRDNQHDAAVANATVYICKSTGAKRYHLKENCHGLNRCTHTIESTTIKKAEAKGLTLCKFED